MKRTTVYLVLTIVFILALVVYATYAIVSPSISTDNLNISTQMGNNISFTSSGGGVMSNYIDLSAMSEDNASNVVATATKNITVTLDSDGTKPICCSYSIIWAWDSTNNAANRYTKTTGTGANEYTLEGAMSETYSTNNTNVSASALKFTKQLPNYNASSLETSMYTATICNNGSGNVSTRERQEWNLTTKFYNLNVPQDNFRGVSLVGRVKVGNVSCEKPPQTLADFIINDAPKSGIDAVSNSAWILTSDHEGEYRYAGKNPDNYISFNGELWRIIGVMPNMTYCTGTYKDANECSTTETGSLVKIIRNSTLGKFRWDYKQTGVGSATTNYGSSDWSDSQLQLMLNGTTYLKTGYDKNGNQLHTSYSIASNVVSGNGYNYYNATYSYLDGNGTTVYVPSSATTSEYTATSGTVTKKIGSDYIDKIATVKWDLYGTSSYKSETEGSPAAFYNIERNINSTGAVYSGNPTYWYGKVGLMYPSDYGYATNGGNSYNRTACLGYQMFGWSSGSYKTDCAGNSWLWYTGIEGSAPGSSGTYQWTLSPHSPNAASVVCVTTGGFVYGYDAFSANTAVRPVLYLSADTIYGGEGEGTYNSPYTIG